ncbi:hypothetical protein GCM10010160_67120 [Acrocarpospora corrugata]
MVTGVELASGVELGTCAEGLDADGLAAAELSIEADGVAGAASGVSWLHAVSRAIVARMGTAIRL